MRSGWMMLVVGAALAGCAVQPGIESVTASWDQCAAQVTKETEDRGRDDAEDSSAYIGASGRVLEADIRAACGFKPSPPDLLPEHWAILRERCVAGPFDVVYKDMSEAEKSWFREYSELSPVRLRAELECRRIHAASRPALNVAPAVASGLPVYNYRPRYIPRAYHRYSRPPKRHRPPKPPKRPSRPPRPPR